MVQKILVPIDGSDTAALGLAEAIALAKPLRARLCLLHVVEDVAWLVDMAAVASSETLQREVRRQADEVLAKARATAAASDVEAQTLVRETVGVRPADVIVDAAGELGCDMIVMGTHGRRALGRLLLGSDALSVVQDSPVPVLLVRQPRPV